MGWVGGWTRVGDPCPPPHPLWAGWMAEGQRKPPVLSAPWQGPCLHLPLLRHAQGHPLSLTDPHLLW